MRVLVTGSRAWLWSKPIFDALDQQFMSRPARFAASEFVVVHGDAAGADRIADIWARTRADVGWPVVAEPHPADWSGAAGRRAGIVRNEAMVALGADMCLAFIRAGSRGAHHCASVAEGAGIPTTVRHWEAQPWTLRDLVDEPYLNRHNVIAEARHLGVIFERTAPYQLIDAADPHAAMAISAYARWRGDPKRHEAVMTIGANPAPQTLDAAYVLAEVAALRRMAQDT
jgi:hypothetical protein